MRRGPKRKTINDRLTIPGSTSADSVPVPPLPVGQAVAALPGQYLRALTRPSSGTFLEEKDKGSWALVWIQLLGSTTLGIAIRMLTASTSAQGVTSNILRDQLLALAIGGPLLFFLSGASSMESLGGFLLKKWEPIWPSVTRCCCSGSLWASLSASSRSSPACGDGRMPQWVSTNWCCPRWQSRWCITLVAGKPSLQHWLQWG
jgi:hypothetical protein